MVELKFIMPNNSTTVQLLRIMEMIVYLGETMELFPHNTNTRILALISIIEVHNPLEAISIYFINYEYEYFGNRCTSR